ncbi:GNAT family N-acetyltransferase [Arabiibacter massiliensis]|uniref:GNAT family N-acetyltransferase n=1 Tax=Arabiibacter massiliensis TaxID=1870985 RepID=UPI0009BA6D6D|nr:GNAT family N-acetyltransferase [Arabiibacter massiliensis]
MRFRRTSEKDIDRVMDVLAEGRASLGALGIDQWQGGYPHREAIEGDVAAGDSYLVEDDGGRIVATAMVGFSGERDYDRIERGAWLTAGTSDDPRYGVVHRVAVSSACRGRGAASLLLERAEQLARERGRASVRVDTHPGNAPMRRLLEKRGYTECGTIYIAHAEEATPDRIAYEKLV